MSVALRRLAELVRNAAPTATVPEEALRVLEAVLFASLEPQSAAALRARLPVGTDLDGALAELRATYAGRGVNLVWVAGGWAFRTAPDLAYALAPAAPPTQKLSRAALEVLAIIAYHQPTTRAEIEELRGVSISKGTIDLLLATGWVRLGGRRRAPGRPMTFGTTPAFLSQFGLSDLNDLPDAAELQALGLGSSRVGPAQSASIYDPAHDRPRRAGGA